MLNDNVKNVAMAVKNAVYILSKEELNKYEEDTRLTYIKLCNFISDYLMERIAEGQKYFKKL